MARPGYVQARQAVYALEQAIREQEARYEVINTLPEVLRAVQRAEVEVNLAALRAQLIQAQARFETFRPRVPTRTPQQHFEVSRSLVLPMHLDLLQAALRRCKIDGIRFPELVRRALRAYLES